MAHSREFGRREFNRRRLRIKNKWEVVLVLVVVAAGIVITTVAAIKAREKRQLSTHTESKQQTQFNISNPTVSQVSEVVTSHSSNHRHIVTPYPHNNQKYNNNTNKKISQQLNNSSGRHIKHSDFTPDYDVEYDMIKTLSDEYTAMASESVEHLPKNSHEMYQNHDGLPAFPPPHGAITDFGSNAELAAEAAGFVIDTPTKQPLQLKLAINNDHKVDENSQKTSVKDDLTKNNQNNNNNNRLASNNNQVKQIPVFTDPLPVQRKLADVNKDGAKIAIPVKHLNSRITVKKEKRPNVTPQQASEIKNLLPSIESAIRFLSLSDELPHPIDYNVASLPATRLQLPVRRFIMPNQRRKRSIEIRAKPNILTKPNKNPNINDSNPTQKTFSTTNPINNKNVTHVTNIFKNHINAQKDLLPEESRFLSFDESLFRTEDREDSDSDEDSDEHISPLFNFDDMENRFSSSLPSEEHKNKHETQQNYYTGESRKQQNYGILGSGNFEIIRGGIYTDEESAPNNIQNHSKEKSQQTNRKSANSSPQTMQNDSPDSNSNGNNNNNNGNNYSEDDDLTQFTAPFNFDFFSANPVLGFQGYDNFGAASVEKFDENQNSRKINDNNQQRRRFYDPHSSASNLFSIFTDKDLDADS